MKRREFLSRTAKGALYATPVIMTVNARAQDGVYCDGGIQVYGIQAEAPIWLDPPPANTLYSGPQRFQTVTITGCGFSTSNIDTIDVVGASGDTITFTAGTLGFFGNDDIFVVMSDSVIVIPELHNWCWYGTPFNRIDGCGLTRLPVQTVNCRNVGTGSFNFYSGGTLLYSLPVEWIPNLIGCP